MKALAPALAAEPQPREAADLMATLSARAVAEEQRRREAAALRTNLDQAKVLLAQGDAPGAASLLRQVLAAGPNEEARRLLDNAQAAIVARASRTAEEKGTQIAAALGEARQLQAAGKLPEALNRLETVLALDPGNAAARELRGRILTAQKTGEQGALKGANDHLAAGRYEEALAAANRVLALERGNSGALQVVRQAYAQISRRLLAGSGASGAPGAAGAGVNLPPALRFVDQRQEVDGEQVELAATSDFRLSGIAIDRSPVAVAFFDARNRPLPGSSRSQAVGETYITEFSLRRRLGAGDTAITVVATDSAGLSSRSQYSVRYLRPWYLSPWTYLLGGGAVTGLAALAGLRRRRHRRLRRERRFNPYVAGGPIFDEALFYGREPLVQRILQTVHNNSLLLHGERRIGKTSLLHQVQRRLEALDDPDYEFHPVYVDLQGTPEERLFATLADPIHEAVLAVGGNAGGRTGTDVEPEAPVAGPAAAERVPALDRIARGESYTHHDLVRELHGWLKALRERSAKQVKLVLLIDEVDELNEYDPRVSQSLRSLFMKRFAENLAAVVAGVRIRKEWEKEGSPWYNFFEEIAVDSIAPEEARRLVLEPVRGTFRFAPGAAERIVTLSGAKPFQIQRRCLALVQRLHEEGRSLVTLEDVETTQPAGSEGR